MEKKAIMKKDILMTAQAIAAEILRDREKAIDCFSCGRSFIYKAPSGDDSGRFCHSRCREWFDAGNPVSDPSYTNKSNPRWYSLPIGPHGFYIDCAGCGKRFDSKGLRCCSTDCERQYRQRGETADLMAEVGMEAPAKRPCQAPGSPAPSRNGAKVGRSRATPGAARQRAPSISERPEKASGAIPEV